MQFFLINNDSCFIILQSCIFVIINGDHNVIIMIKILSDMLIVYHN